MVIEHAFTKSGHVLGFSYSTESQIINVRFKNGSTYTHSGVPREAVDNFMKFRSAGEFYHGIIQKYRLVGKLQKQ